MFAFTVSTSSTCKRRVALEMLEKLRTSKVSQLLRLVPLVLRVLTIRGAEKAVVVVEKRSILHVGVLGGSDERYDRRLRVCLLGCIRWE